MIDFGVLLHRFNIGSASSLIFDQQASNILNLFNKIEFTDRIWSMHKNDTYCSVSAQYFHPI